MTGTTDEGVRPRHSGRTELAVLPRLKDWNRLTPRSDPTSPEPEPLYALICLTLTLHTDHVNGSPIRCKTCLWCGEPWPCNQVRLAFRLREGF
jgi:hypothetical protein